MKSGDHPKEKSLFEHRRQKPLSKAAFRARLAKYLAGAVLLVCAALGIGVVGYHVLASLPWVDAFLDASMILSGMGPVNELKTDAAKLFAGCYALFSGLLFIAVAGLIFGPLIHRLLHKFHFEEESSLDK